MNGLEKQVHLILVTFKMYHPNPTSEKELKALLTSASIIQLEDNACLLKIQGGSCSQLIK